MHDSYDCLRHHLPFLQNLATYIAKWEKCMLLVKKQVNAIIYVGHDSYGHLLQHLSFLQNLRISRKIVHVISAHLYSLPTMLLWYNQYNKFCPTKS